LEPAAFDPRSGYVPVGDLRAYYEIEGDGRPLVLLHGGFGTIDTTFEKLKPLLAHGRRLVAFERQGHGRTADLDRPLRYEQMVEDAAAVLRHLEIDDADLFGFSDGGVVALGLAARHPSLVRRAGIIGAGYGADAKKPEAKAFLDQLSPNDDRIARFREAYKRVAPHPEAWPVLIVKLQKMWREFGGWPAAEMCSLRAPLLVMLGDDDFVPLDHAIEMYRTVPHARLAVLPGSDHDAPIARSEWVAAMLTDFLDAPAVEAGPSSTKED
jgi:pimeloyl-ACP methyl ester carboxylesterase